MSDQWTDQWSEGKDSPHGVKFPGNSIWFHSETGIIHDPYYDDPGEKYGFTLQTCPNKKRLNQTTWNFYINHFSMA